MKPKKENLIEKLKELKDFRRGQGRMHELSTVLIIVLMSIMSGYFGVRAKGDFMKRNRKDLIKRLKPKNNKLPSHQTIARVLENIDFDEFTNIFYNWAQDYVEIEKGEWLKIDGKGINGTITNTSTGLQKFTNLVTLFTEKRKQALVVGKVEDKSNEIPLVKELIKMLDLKGVVFTADALHCQKETTRAIIGSNNDYVIGVKSNQNRLEKQIKKTSKTVIL